MTETYLQQRLGVKSHLVAVGEVDVFKQLFVVFDCVVGVRSVNQYLIISPERAVRHEKRSARHIPLLNASRQVRHNEYAQIVTCSFTKIKYTRYVRRVREIFTFNKMPK